MRATAILVAIFLSRSVQSAPPADEVAYAAVSGVATFKRLHSGDPLYPWERAEFEREQREARRRGEEPAILISNGGSHVDFTYYLYRLGNTRHTQSWKARGLLGEWGHVREFILEGPHLVKFRNWRGTNYMMNSVLIHTDGAR